MNEAGVEACIGQESELQPLASLLSAIEAAEVCCIEHEKLSARIGTGTCINGVLDAQQESQRVIFEEGGRRSEK